MPDPTTPTPDAVSDYNALWFGIKALSGYGADIAQIWERLEDVLGTERAGMVVSALHDVGVDEIEEGNR